MHALLLTLLPRWPARLASSATTPGTQKTPSVLLVDDDSAVRESLRRMLSTEDLMVTTAAGGAEAMRAIELHEPDLLITDLCMASTDGWDLIVRENRLRPAIPIFVITALPARETGGADQLAKQFSKNR